MLFFAILRYYFDVITSAKLYYFALSKTTILALAGLNKSNKLFSKAITQEYARTPISNESNATAPCSIILSSTILCFVTPGSDSYYHFYNLYAFELLLRLMWFTWLAKDV